MTISIDVDHYGQIVNISISGYSTISVSQICPLKLKVLEKFKAHDSFNIIYFETLGQKIQNGEISSFGVDPSMQLIFQTQGTPNAMITVNDRNGNRLLVKGKLDPQIRMIYPPV